ncbi:DUF4384 domain-containing protein [Stagnihabitans tardus]|uniref:DUF4384 domain-containing protein n=1 Tax=Stagnihabitans tardus TaxID=2699202 RepID=A0AAE4YCD1_9RHOB|nr:DUF4384 domain-containing protein [Stagnihabitans tardus]NBZ88811.1 hypothetical protein [Stagnihabitans tardus]
MTALAPQGPGALGLSAGFLGSVVLHGLGAALFLALAGPSALPDQPLPKSELRIETQGLTEDRAKPKAAPGERLAERAPQAQRLAEGALPVSTAEAIAPLAEPAPAVRPGAPALTAAAPSSAALSAVAAAPPLAAAPAPGPALAAAAPQGAPLAAAAPPPGASAPVTPDLSPVTAELAWSGEGTVDPVSVQAIASFMRPGEVQGDKVRDGLEGLLASVPCGRVQAEFDPATGGLALRGHIPEEGLKAPLLEALQAQLGAGIAVRAELAILPRPQCGALAGIADVGLPQSQDQLTNPRLIGADAQARTFTYGAGQSLVLDLAAPDYDAYLYVDYFDAGGNVIHLTPNDQVPLRLREAKTALKVGAGDQGEPFLQITVGPPYGQEIAVAFAASAPLFEGLRPLMEPAGPYLEALKAKVAEARAKDPEFKGEWVYFMVVTHP